MRGAIVSYNYLLSPTACEKEELFEKIESLTEINELVKNLDFSLFCEEDALEKLIDLNLFPTEKLFSANLSRHKITTHSPKDLARIVNNIIDRMRPLSTALSDIIAQWEKRDFKPKFFSMADSRKNELEQLLETIILNNNKKNLNFCLLHYCEHNKSNNIEVSGILSYCYPEIFNEYPVEFVGQVDIYDNYRKFLCSMEISEIFSKCSSSEDFKFLFYVSAIKRLSLLCRPISDLRYEEFEIGDDFLDSLKMNQCMFGQKFSNVMIETVSAILTREEFDESIFFKKSLTDKSQRTSKGFKAFREHITGSGLALRLMFWRNDEGLLILSNVGPKHELFISDPKYNDSIL